ncbi:hypothetical protein CC80DRAFT_462693 [Byssothecium circinans]|uniref:Nuclear pore complex component n=1 Tax=Byssothecium circinans TaxID=147558 RepID=A0A6A5UF15_9PLEO|nr:hypothetical protein CC80DRAFT_462693 [Byssothecium circinans]
MDRSLRLGAANPPPRPSSGFEVGSAAVRSSVRRPASAPPTPTPATPVTPSAQRIEGTPTGSWKHPQFDEITRRQHAIIFDESNVRTIIANGGLLLLSWVTPTFLEPIAFVQIAYKPLASAFHKLPYNEWIVNSIRLVFLVNIIIAFLPLVRRYYPDDIADIALTPSQRQIMGLKPDIATPQTPGSAYASPNYVTPPRYQKSTPRSSFSNQGSQSPLSGSPNLGRSTSNSPFSSNNTGSPLFQKTLSGGSAKRSSFGGSSMGSSFFNESSSSAGPGTPTPGAGKASVGLNNKWLYEKRRESPRSSLFN